MGYIYNKLEFDIKSIKLECPECPKPSCPECPSVNKECPKCPDMKCPDNNNDCPPCNCPASNCPASTQYPTVDEISSATLNKIFPGRDNSINASAGFPVSAFGSTSCPYAYPIDDNNLQLINISGPQPASPPASPPANPTSSPEAVDRAGFVGEGERGADTPPEEPTPPTEPTDDNP